MDEDGTTTKARALPSRADRGAPRRSAPCWMKAVQARFSASSSCRLESTYVIDVCVCVCVCVCGYLYVCLHYFISTNDKHTHPPPPR